MKITSGTLRQLFNNALQERVVCKNALLMVLAAMNSDKAYSDKEKQMIASVLIYHHCSKDYIGAILPQISVAHFPAKHQIDSMVTVLSGSYTYQRYYVKDSFLKSVDWDSIPGKQKRINMSEKAKAIKQYIYENKKIEFILESMGCSNICYTASKGYWSCTNPGGDNVGAVNIFNIPYLRMKNWSKNYENDIYTFIMKSMGISFEQAVVYLCELLGLEDDGVVLNKAYRDYSASIEASLEDKDEEQATTGLDETVLQRFEPLLHIDWYKESIMPWTRDKFDIRYDYEKQRVVIPVRDHDSGMLLATNSRTMIPDFELFGYKKYDLTPGYKKSRNIYGLWENKAAIKKNDCVIVFEGCKSVLKLDTLYQRTVEGVGRSIGVAIMGSDLSDAQAQILLALNVNIIISFDKDQDIGKICHTCGKLWGKTDKKIYYTIDSENLLDSKDAAIDKGKAVFERIIEKRILFDETEYQILCEDIRKAHDQSKRTVLITV